MVSETAAEPVSSPRIFGILVAIPAGTGARPKVLQHQPSPSCHYSIAVLQMIIEMRWVGR